jgi:tetratricopeptide (TPR) repeat protein
MRTFVPALAAALLLTGSALAEAPLTRAPVGAPSDKPAAIPEAPTPDVPAPTKAEQLDQLFASLKAATDPAEAKVAEGGIVKLWLESGSDTVDLLMTWSMAAMESKDYATALDFLDQILILKPDFAEGWNKRATVYFLLDDYGKSIADIERTLRLEPRHFAALSGLGAILSDLGESQRAIEAYRRALEIDPHMEKVKEALEKLEKETGRDI